MKKMRFSHKALFSVAGVGLLSCMIGAGGMATWQKSIETPTVTIQSGNLDITDASDYTYQEISGDINPLSNVSVTDGKLDRAMAPGDVLTSSSEFKVVLDGDNISGKLTVSTNGGIDQQFGTTKISLIDPSGNVQAGPVNIGENLVVEDLTTDPNGVADNTWTVKSETTFGNFDDSSAVREQENIHYTATLEQVKN